MYTLLRALAWSSLAACTAAVAGGSALHGSATLTSDYVFRGISQSRGDPALQAGLRLDSGSGVYVSSWASTLKPYPDNGAEAEVDWTAGWQGALERDFTLDANVTRYTYPGARRAASDYNELVGTLRWRDTAWLQAGWSNDVFASGRSALYSELGARLPLARRLDIKAAVGRYQLAHALGRNYSHAVLALAYTRGAYVLRLAAHVTDRAAHALFPRLAGRRIECSLSASF